MSTNPYASPVDGIDPGNHAEQEIRSVIRTFRILAVFAIAESVLVSITFTYSLAVNGGVMSGTVVFLLIHAVVIACGIFYLRVAGKMARRQLDAARWSRALCLAMIFPIGLLCFAVLPIVGILCYLKVRRHYTNFCAITEDSVDD